MIVYANRNRPACPAEALGRLAARAGQGEPVRDVLIDFGILEAGVADAICSKADEDGPLLRAFRHLSLLMGRQFARQPGDRCGPWLARALESARLLRLPPSVFVSTPEGYAYYCLFPEAYVEAARRFAHERNPRNAVVIGIRSIGTSLSAAVCGALEDAGCETASFTVRPRAHPFDRRLVLSAGLEAEWRARAGSCFLIVDEGPGLSGSSFASVARKLSGIGVADDRIVLFPSWLPEPGKLLSEHARGCWRRHPKYVTQFDARTLLPGRQLRDLSAGRWRSLFYDTAGRSPAVQPQHERVKYFCGARLWKFEGLGEFGRKKLARAKELAEAGFSPRPFGLEQGFLTMTFEEGRPVSGHPADTDLLETMARYAAFLHRQFRAAQMAPVRAVFEMLAVNAREGLGPEWGRRAERFGEMQDAVLDSPVVEVDGRMLPHEWLRTPRGYLKTDNLDHCDDHFFPGCQDIAWDLAGAVVEFDLDTGGEAFLLERYCAHSGDSGAPARMAFYRAAYLAYRMGYADLAARSLDGGPDGEKFARMTEKYAAGLRREIAQ